VKVWLSVAAAVVGLALLALAVVHGRGTSLPHVDAVTVSGSMTGGRQGFGDAVPAVVDVLVPNREVDPASVTLKAALDPYSVQGRVSREQRTDGGTTLVRFRFDAWCVRRACLPREGGADFALPPATIAYTLRSGASKTAALGWPQVGVVTRLTAIDAGELRWHPGIRPLEAMSYRMPPRLLALLLALAGLGVVAAGVPLVRPAVQAAVAAIPSPDPLRRRSFLERALIAVRHAAAGEDLEERRRALDLLARELRQARRRDAARDARQLAWSEGRPDAGAMEELADRVEGASA